MSKKYAIPRDSEIHSMLQIIREFGDRCFKKMEDYINEHYMEAELIVQLNEEKEQEVIIDDIQHNFVEKNHRNTGEVDIDVDLVLTNPANK